MKFFQPLILTTALVVTFSSCKKESLVAPAPPTPVTPPPAVLAIPMEAYLKFNGNLTDSTAKLTSATPSGNILYVNDRNGNANSALYLDGSTKITFAGLNIKGKATTMTAWLKYSDPTVQYQPIVTAFVGTLGGMQLYQGNDKFGGSVSIPGTNNAGSNSLDANWHHIAVSYDGTDIKTYIDGVLAATKNYPGNMGDGVCDLIVGALNTFYFKGYIDDLRVYNTILSATDVQQLAALN